MTQQDLMILHELQEIKRRQSWWLDLGANVAGNVLYDGAAFLLKGLIRRL